MKQIQRIKDTCIQDQQVGVSSTEMVIIYNAEIKCDNEGTKTT